ncbi:hypothetical protein QBC47DRAFT_201251 [Echria macrotheca]|uniref:Uncharacterized protein n=1 Tax=Echria macrotheca TaxID=438768 RepID=A0AAJ0F5P9_9PEZI|nr:hypothetical protein QBC47DRAFT_201251 [Echria macrotheca]
MGGTKQPFIYEAVKDDERFPASTFDPKAVTRSSYDAKARKPKPKGPLVSVNRHPDSHMVPTGRMNFRTIGRSTKSWIKGMRKLQFCLRLLELVAAVGMLVLMVLISNVEPLTGWVLRITLAVAILHCMYAVYHLSNPAGGRTPGSSAAYHVFAGVSDVCVMPLYAYGALSARNQATAGDGAWRTLLPDQRNVKFFVPAVYYSLISAGGLHLLSLAISLWLGVMFRRITMLPPDMNPLESNLTSRAHKRNKSSVVTIDSDKRLTTGSERPLSQAELSRPPTIPFMHTRQNSQTTLAGSHDGRLDLPSRQYQIPHPNSPRNSIDLSMKRMSAPPPRSSPRPGNYIDIPLGEASPRPSSTYSSFRPDSSTVASGRPEIVSAEQTAQPRAAKFTEAWYASESLIGRTQQRTRAINAANSKRQTYAALDQRYDISPESDSEDEQRNNQHDYANPNSSTTKPRPRSYHGGGGGGGAMSTADENDENDMADGGLHPNPLRSHPTATPSPSASSTAYAPGGGSPSRAVSPPPRKKTPFARVRNSVLSAINLNDRRVSGSGEDIADLSMGHNRDSSIQMDSEFYSKPYGALKPGTPPIMIGGGGINDKIGRQVSSGNDFDLGSSGNGVFGRRHVSGKIAEEGRAGRGFRYGSLDE